MKRIYSVPLLLLSLLPCFLAAQTPDFKQHKDSLLNVIANAEGEAKFQAYDELKTYLFYNDKNPESLLELLSNYEREALKQGDKQKAATCRRNIITVRTGHNRYEQLFENAEDDLKFISGLEAWDEYFIAYSTVVETYFRAGQKEKAMEEALKCYEKAKQVNTPDAKAQASFIMGFVYVWSARNSEAENYFKESLEESAKAKKGYDIAQKTYAYLHQAYANQGKFDSLGELLQKWEKEIKALEQEGKGNPMYRMNFYEASARYYYGIGNYDKMEDYCKLIESTPFPDRLNALNYYRKEAAMARGEYDKALEYADKITEFSLKTNDIYGQFAVARDKTEALIYLGETKKSIASFNHTLSLKDSLLNIDIQSQLDELRTQYEVDKHIAEKQRNRNYFLFAFGGCILLAIALGIWIYHDRTITRKNRELVRKNQEWANVKTLHATSLPDAGQETTGEKITPAAPDEADWAIMDEIEKLIAAGLYKDSNLSLDMLAEKTGQNPTYISKAVSRCAGKNIKTYINEYRIKEAIRILSDENSAGISVEDLAFDSGFNDRKTFHRIFRNITGLSPTDFKKNGLRK
ncbi:MAG: helix-turn-helix domain-containing protein [Dysgonamonadaceae bacterium]|jgi:AraC-like DNA-binding protein|nr:helix-turn-helix domain-containing protein [Dysgonamonadaceae bacterium]